MDTISNSGELSSRRLRAIDGTKCDCERLALTEMESASRSAIRVLDDRLHLLEDAMERGERFVSAALANSISASTLPIAAGTPISAAMEIVFRQQEALLSQRSACLGGNSNQDPSRRLGGPLHAGDRAEAEVSDGCGVAALSLKEAQVLTARIKAEINHVCLLLAEAHDRKAWRVLGYKTWEAYVRREIGYSRSRSYELLDQARAIRSIQVAAGTTRVPEISAYAARQIKAHMPRLSSEIRKAMDNGPSPDTDECLDIVNEVIATVRSHAAPQRVSLPAVLHRNTTMESDDDRLLSTIRYLAELGPPSPQLVSRVAGNAEWLRATKTAIAWLQQLAPLVAGRQGLRMSQLRPAASQGATIASQAV